MASIGSILYVTYVEKERSYVKVWGQTDRNICTGIDKALQQLKPQFQNGEFLPNADSLFYGALCCAFRKDGNCHRARVTNTNFMHQGLIELIFIDYGNKEIVHYSNIRMMTSLPPTISNIPPQAKHYILANVTHPPPAWNDQNFDIIVKELRGLDYQLLTLTHIGPFPLIKLLRNNEDLALSLVSRGLATTVSTHVQVMELQNYLTSMSQQHQRTANIVNPMPSSTPTILTYKTIPLEPGVEHEVFVSYVTDGPCIFSIQLKKMEETLKKLMTEINNVPLIPLDDNPLPGTVCLAKSADDGYICRAVITNMVDDQFKVFYVDFGNSEILPFEEIYQIPFKYVIPKVMATRFALAGLEQSAVSLEMKCAFKKFVNDKLLYLTVKPTTTRSALSLCILRDETGLNVLDVVKRAALNSYPQPVILSRGASHEIKVSYVFSCNRIYVQLMSKQEDLRKLMINLQTICPQLETFTADRLKPNAPCYALFADDSQWYRAVILNANVNQTKIRYVDFGNEETIPLANLKVPDMDKIVMLRPQAIECCLNGYQNMEPDLKRDNILEELLLENEFSMKVVEMQAGRAIVDLFDKSGYNVALLLIEKLRNIHHVSGIISDGGPAASYGGGGGEKLVKHSTPIHHNPRSPLRDNFNSKWNRTEKENWREKPTNYVNNHNNRTSNTKPKFRDNHGTHINHSRSSNESDNSKRYANDSGGKGGGYFKKYESDRSLSDNSEKNRTASPRNDKFSPANKGKSNSRGNAYGGKKKSFDTNSNSSSGSSSYKHHVDYAASNEAYPLIEMTGQTEKVSVTWFHNPLFFYCQLQRYKSDFRKLMEDIQNAYFKRKPGTATTGSPIVALFPEDGVLYRAIVLENNSPSYRVQYVDFGNIAMVDKIWPLEKRFIKLPAQAIHCALAGIKCAEDKWPQPDVYSSYFDRDLFDCTFVSRDLNKYFVDLSLNDFNVGKELIAANLAAAIEEDAVDLSLLFGQQLRATITSVFDLKQFVVSFDNVVAKCCAHNVETATELNMNLLKSYINAIVIMYVDAVEENVLIVTLYDERGSKIEILKPDDGAYDTVEVLCAMPVFTSTITGCVTHLNANSVCLQPKKYSAKVSHLLCNMYDRYNGTESADITVLEGTVYAVLSVDQNWYRGRAVKIVDDDIHIVYIDYGNEEIVKTEQLRTLDDQFFIDHMMAVKVSVAKDPGGYLDQEVTLRVWYGDEDECWHGEILNVNNTAQIFDSPAIKFNESSPPLVNNIASEMHANDDQVIQAIVTETRAVDENQVAQGDTIEVQVIDGEAPCDGGLGVVLSHADSPSDFYLRLQEDDGIVANLQCALRDQIDSLAVLENPAAGVLCAALYSLDQQWYRAQILDYDKDIITVRFVDYGNTDVLDNNNATIKTLPIELITLAQYARRCSLKIKSTEETDEWSPAAYQRFAELTAHNLTVKIVDQDEKITYVNLYADGVDVAETLIAEGHAVAVDLNLEATCTGFISHLNSPSEFYVQLESAVGDLEWTAEQLATAHTFVDIEDLTPGALCAAVYPEDEMWYRARILSNTVAGLEVLFVDYGNSCTCTNMKELPEDLVMLPPLAQKCSLDKPAGVLQWSPQANEKFKEISADGAAIFTINKIKPGETTVVQLLLNGEDISQYLLPVLERDRVVRIVALDKIYAIKAVDEEKLRTIEDRIAGLDEMHAIENADEEETVVCEIDGKRCRASVLKKTEDGYVVRTMDTVVEAKVNTVYQLPDDCKDVCVSVFKLDSLPGVQFTEDSLTKLIEINDNAKGIFDIEYVAPNVLRLYSNGSDVRSQLGGIKLSPINSLQSTPKKIAKPSTAEYEDVKEMCETEMARIVDAALTTSDTNNCDTSTTEEDVAVALPEANEEEEVVVADTSTDSNEATPETSDTDLINDTNETITIKLNGEELILDAKTFDKGGEHEAATNGHCVEKSRDELPEIKIDGDKVVEKIDDSTSSIG